MPGGPHPWLRVAVQIVFDWRLVLATAALVRVLLHKRCSLPRGGFTPFSGLLMTTAYHFVPGNREKADAKTQNALLLSKTRRRATVVREA